jgi:uncharacterized protein (TIGR04255 family)
MAINRHLKNAPIREALIDIQFEPHVSLEDIGKFSEALKHRFSHPTKIWQQSFGVEFSPVGDSRTSTEQATIGLRLESLDHGHVVQGRINGFTFSKLPPYNDWPDLRESAAEIWRIFVEVTRPMTVNRVAVRYINACPLPRTLADLSDYFTAAPQIPTELPQTLTAFLQRVVIVDHETGRTAAVTQALEEPQGKVTVFLDIDCFYAIKVTPNDTELWSTLDSLREFKNNIFFSHITEQTVKLFE